MSNKPIQDDNVGVLRKVAKGLFVVTLIFSISGIAFAAAVDSKYRKRAEESN